ncbi:MAG: phytoene desaturase family protein, partial [Bacteriovoracia bacterium]
SEYDIIVIGSGLGGLTAANILARQNHKVLLVEQHSKLGGLATWFRRPGGHIFDVSLHGFPYGMVKSCRKYWGKDIANDIVQLENLRFQNPVYDITTDFTREDFTHKLIHEFKVPEKNVKQFFDTIFDPSFHHNNIWSNRQLFEEFFPGRNDVMRFLMEPIVYANGSTLEDEALTYAIVFSNFMKKGVYTFKGGTDYLIGKMKRELLNNGVDIKYNCQIDDIIVKDRQVKGVRINDQTIKSRAVLSNGNLLSTIFSMVGQEHFDRTLVEKAQKVRLNSSSCQVYFGIKKGETIDEVGDLIFTSKDENFNTDAIMRMGTGWKTFSFYYPKTKPQTNRYTIVASTNARYDDWKHLSEESYNHYKQQLIDDSLIDLERFIPEVRKKIDYMEAATPSTFERYTLHQKGSSFGTKFEGLEVSQNLSKQIQGLYHTGSVGIIMSGWLGAINYGAIQSYEIDNTLRNI